MKGNRTVYKSKGRHLEHTVVLHKHLKEAERESKAVSSTHFTVSHHILSTAKCHQLGWSAGELFQRSAVVSHQSTFLPPSKGRINIQIVLSSCPLASCPLCLDCQTSAAAGLSYICPDPLLQRTRFSILVNQTEPFQTIPLSVSVTSSVSSDENFSSPKCSLGLCRNWMMMHFWHFPERAILQLLIKPENHQHRTWLLFTTECVCDNIKGGKSHLVSLVLCVA